jgi:general secretion pathway protein D
MDISAVDSFQNIGGITQPVIGQRKIEHEIRLREGEVNLLGGIFEDQDTKALSGLPGLSQIPILKYLFSQTNTEHRESEIVFAIVPHIIRGPEGGDGDEEMIDVGTGNQIELRQVSKSGPAAAPTSPAPSQVNPTTAPPATNAPPPSVNPQPTATPGGATFLFDPPAISAATGSTFVVNIMLSGAQNVYSVPLQLNYDPTKLQIVNVSNGGFLSQDGQAVALVHRDDATKGAIQVTATRPPGSGGISGQGAVITLTFMAKAGGQATLSITRGGARDAGMQPITVAGAQAMVNIQ